MGEYLRFAEVRPGDTLGDISLLNRGLGFSHCASLTECQVAILGTMALDDMLAVEPLMAGYHE